MKTEYRYIRFEKIGQTQKTSKWACMNQSGDYELGRIEWYGPWRQYCFMPEGGIVFNTGCMQDILHFIGQLKAERNKPETATMELE